MCFILGCVGSQEAAVGGGAIQPVTTGGPGPRWGWPIVLSLRDSRGRRELSVRLKWECPAPGRRRQCDPRQQVLSVSRRAFTLWSGRAEAPGTPCAGRGGRGWWGRGPRLGTLPARPLEEAQSRSPCYGAHTSWIAAGQPPRWNQHGIGSSRWQGAWWTGRGGQK